jgi:hypothetical protein
MKTVVPSPQRLASYRRRRDQVINTLLTAMTLHAEVLRPVEVAHLNAAIALLRASTEER